MSRRRSLGPGLSNLGGISVNWGVHGLDMGKFSEPDKIEEQIVAIWQLRFPRSCSIFLGLRPTSSTQQ